MITIDVEGLQLVLTQLNEKISDLSEPMELIADDLNSLVATSFQKGEGPNGEAWPALSDTTLALRGARKDSKGGTTYRRNKKGAARAAKRIANAKPLRDRGNLAKSITTTFGPRFAVVGTNSEYGPTQHFGRPDNKVFGKAPGPIPARPFLPVDQNGKASLPEESVDKIRERLIDYITKK